MQCCTAYIQVVFVAAVQDDEGEYVDQQSGTRHYQHHRPHDLRRGHKTTYSFEQNPADYEQQAQPINECGQYLKALVAITPFGVGRSRTHAERECSQGQRHRVGQHVAGVRQQRQ